MFYIFSAGMSTPEDRLNSFLPYLDPQQAAAVLVWAKQNKVCDVEQPLKELLEAYPIEWAHEELGWPMQGFPLEMNYMEKSSEPFWPDILKATLALRGDVPNSAFDFSKVPERLVEGLRTLGGRLTNSAVGAARRKNIQAMFELAWLLHSALWILMRYYAGFGKAAGVASEQWTELLEELFSDRVLQTVSIVCPHLARYYVVLILPNRKRTDNVWQVVTLITSIKYKLDDPFIRFAMAIFHETSLVDARRELHSLVSAPTTDFLLSQPEVRKSILANARLLIFEHYCRVHRSLDLDIIRQLALLDGETGSEKWIVNLIKDAKIEAKIDVVNNVIQMTSAPTNPYAAIIEKSKSTFHKTNQLIRNLSSDQN